MAKGRRRELGEPVQAREASFCSHAILGAARLGGDEFIAGGGLNLADREPGSPAWIRPERE
jgi:hypothetical protein